jgi:hypothetical protein
MLNAILNDEHIEINNLREKADYIRILDLVQYGTKIKDKEELYKLSISIGSMKIVRGHTKLYRDKYMYLIGANGTYIEKEYAKLIYSYLTGKKIKKVVVEW